MGPKAWVDVAGCIADPAKPANIKCLEALFSNIVSLIVTFAGLALFVMIVYGGFTYLTAGADAEKTGKARQIMIWAIMGIVFMILSYIILITIKWLTGVDVMKFEIPYYPAPTPT